ncbi:MAG TPA: SRPBCC domain-containing protein [Candidatus Limnocylindrales bacterium]
MSMDQPSFPAGTDTQRWVRMRRRLDAPPDRVFRTWTDPEELARWLPERIEGGLAVGSRSALVWSDRRVWWDVTLATPNRLFAFRRGWQPDDRLVTETRITIDPAGYGTRLELVDGPFPLDVPGGLDAWAEATEMWADALAKLRAHIDFSVDIRPRG